MDSVTPLMRQYWDIKNQHLDKILLFRMGDFYEMFHNDAIIAAPILNIALTARNKKALDETPMCGMPYHSVSGPIGKLLAAGYKVAICEQLEDPSAAKGIVRRGVTKVLSPGMVYDPDTLDELTNNFVAAYDSKSIAFLDASVGKALSFQIDDTDEIRTYLALLKPIELILTSSQRESESAYWTDDLHLTVFDDLDVLWPEPFHDLSEAATRLLTYAVHMQGPSFLASLRPFENRNVKSQVKLSPQAIRHLEIFQSYRGLKEGSLFHAIDRTKTSAGARKLREWFHFPLQDLSQIQNRQQDVKKWQRDVLSLKGLREQLGRLSDLERRVSKVSYATCHPKDLLSLAHTLEVALQIFNSDGVVKTKVDIESLEFCFRLIGRALHDEPPASIKAGGFIKKGFNSDLDQLIELTDNGSKKLAELEAREKTRTNISSLKVRYNQVFGYFIEITNTHKEKVPPDYRRKQTLANAERFVTDELSDLEVQILSGKSKRIDLEDGIFSELKTELQLRTRSLLQAAEVLSELDVASAFAWLALEQNYVLPELALEGSLSLLASRHPVVEQQVKKDFVANDIQMEKGQVFLLTGPNMAGKSTVMRQVALIAILAQVGAPVPCQKAHLPVFDGFFTRVGASDFLSEGLSTFMVEMKESAQILEDVTERSLVILDEIGRGTSTYDGLSLAQAILEHLLESRKAYIFFATHYHELTRLQEKYSSLSNVHMAISDRNGKVQFLHSLKKGAASKSYGIHVAQLAGLPKDVLARAATLLKGLETQIATDQLSLAGVDVESEKSPSPIQIELKELNVSLLTPIDALNTIHRWQQQLDS